MLPAALVACWLAVSQDSSVLLVRILDVSDSRIGGEAILITDSSDGRGQHVLLDASDRGRTVVSWLELFGVDSLAAVILSHPHADHYGGIDEVLGWFPVGAFVYAGTPRSAVTYRVLLRQIDELGIPVVTADSGVRRLTLVTGSDSVVLLLIASPPACRMLASDDGDDINNCSLGVKLVRDGFTMLLPGDGEENLLAWWMAQYDTLLHADVLKAGHHGSRNATNAAWLDAVRPQAVVISANGRQHPFAEVLGLLAIRGIPTYCTADHGTITVRVPRIGPWTVTTERPGTCHPRTRL